MPEYSGTTITPADSVQVPVMNGNTPGNFTLAALRSFILAAKGLANGLAELDGNGKLPASQLPELADDVIVVASYATLPATGTAGKLYITQDNNKGYRWAFELGTPAYVQLFDPAVITAVANIISGAQVVGKATADGAGNNIPNTYATKSSVSDIVNGVTVVGKANKDGNGNVIPDTYETKTNVATISGKCNINADNIETLQKKVGPFDFENIDKEKEVTFQGNLKKTWEDMFHSIDKESNPCTMVEVVNVPASSASDGTVGDVAVDSDYFYVCIATNSWKRVALSTF